MREHDEGVKRSQGNHRGGKILPAEGGQESIRELPEPLDGFVHKEIEPGAIHQVVGIEVLEDPEGVVEQGDIVGIEGVAEITLEILRARFDLLVRGNGQRLRNGGGEMDVGRLDEDSPKVISLQWSNLEVAIGGALDFPLGNERIEEFFDGFDAGVPEGREQWRVHCR